MTKANEETAKKHSEQIAGPKTQLDSGPPTIMSSTARSPREKRAKRGDSAAFFDDEVSSSNASDDKLLTEVSDLKVTLTQLIAQQSTPPALIEMQQRLWRCGGKAAEACSLTGDVSTPI